MSPSLPATRPVWVWSLPAFAIILSFLWYRKKRGSLKTDSGGAGETQDDQTSAEYVENVLIPEISGVESVSISAEEEVEVIVEGKVVEVLNQSVPVPVESVEEGPLEEPKEKEQEEEEEEVKKVEAEEPVAVEEAVAEVEVEKVEEDTPKSRSKCGKKKKEMAKMNESLDQRQSKEENTACILEQKLAKLDLAKQCSSEAGEEKQTNDDDAERDSANNSPSEVMLASPSVSGYSDTHSEVSPGLRPDKVNI